MSDFLQRIVTWLEDAHIGIGSFNISLARLAGLSSSMRAIAAGDLDHDIPVRGEDESISTLVATRPPKAIAGRPARARGRQLCLINTNRRTRE